MKIDAVRRICGHDGDCCSAGVKVTHSAFIGYGVRQRPYYTPTQTELHVGDYMSVAHAVSVRADASLMERLNSSHHETRVARIHGDRARALGGAPASGISDLRFWDGPCRSARTGGLLLSLGHRVGNAALRLRARDVDRVVDVAQRFHGAKIAGGGQSRSRFSSSTTSNISC